MKCPICDEELIDYGEYKFCDNCFLFLNNHETPVKYTKIPVPIRRKALTRIIRGLPTEVPTLQRVDGTTESEVINWTEKLLGVEVRISVYKDCTVILEVDEKYAFRPEECKCNKDICEVICDILQVLDSWKSISEIDYSAYLL